MNYVLDPASDSEISNLEESDVKESEEFVPVADDEGDDSTDDTEEELVSEQSVSASPNMLDMGE